MGTAQTSGIQEEAREEIVPGLIPELRPGFRPQHIQVRSRAESATQPSSQHGQVRSTAEFTAR